MGIYSVGEGDVKEERRRPSQTLVVLPAFSAILEMTKDRELFCSLNSSFSSLRALRVATWCKCEQQYWSRSLRTTPCYRNLKKRHLLLHLLQSLLHCCLLPTSSSLLKHFMWNWSKIKNSVLNQYTVLAKRSLIKDLVLLRTKLLKCFGPFFDLKSLKQDSTAEMVLFWSFFWSFFWPQWRYALLSRNCKHALFKTFWRYYGNND